jgi:hypothetical protein
MKRFHVLVMFLLLVGCSKTEKPFQNSLRMIFDGQEVNCDREITANVTGSLLTIYGYWKDPDIKEGYVNITLSDFDNTTGEKSFGKTSFGNGGISLVKKYAVSGGGETSSSYYGVDSLTKLVILEVDDKYIKGTFEAVVKSPTFANAPSVTKYITSGQFHIKKSR